MDVPEPKKRSIISGPIAHPMPTHKLFKNIAGTEYGRWSVLSYAGQKGAVHYWNCICKCGAVRVVAKTSLTSGASLSCGCLKNEGVSARRFVNLEGRRFGRLVVQPHHQIVAKRTIWMCACDCGNRTVVEYGNLTSGRTKSCGCFFSETLASGRLTTHNMARSPEYHTWRNIRQRCENPRNKSYHKYGAQGISVCKEWRDSFEAFYADMGARPSSKHKLVRSPDKDGPYAPNNCRWFREETTKSLHEQQNEIGNRTPQKTSTTL